MPDRLVTTNGTADRRGRTINAETAAALLGTTPGVLRLWEDRFGFPLPVASVDGAPRYSMAVVMALREALDRELSLAAAIDEAQRSL
jgi:hypothetical protein